RVHDQRHAHRFERRTGEIGAMLSRRCGQGRAADVREIAAAALDQAATFHEHRDAAALELAAGLALPAIDAEGFTGLGLERSDDLPLQPQQVIADRGHRLMARWPMSCRYCAPSKCTPCTSR